MAADDENDDFDLANASDEDYQKELRRQLLGKMQGFQRGMEADDRYGREQIRDDASTARELAAAAAYNKAFSQFGAIGGQVADTSPVTDYTNQLIKNQQTAQSTGETQQEHKEKLNQYLMGKMLEQEGALGKRQQEKAEREAALGEKKTEAEARKAEKEAELARQKARDAQEQANKKRELDLKEKELATKGDKEKDIKTDQSNAAVYGRRLEQAEQDFDKVMNSGYDPTDTTSAIGRVFPDKLRSEDALLQSQAERNFVNAVLRRESGSAISSSEFESAEKQYFPRAGDTPKVLAQKKRNRQIALNGMKVAAGPAWDKVQLPPEVPTSDVTYGTKNSDSTATAAPAGKTIAKKQYSASRNQTKIIYSDGTEEVVSGKR